MIHNIGDNYFLAHFIALAEMNSSRIKVGDSFSIVLFPTAIPLSLLFFRGLKTKNGREFSMEIEEKSGCCLYQISSISSNISEKKRL